MSSEVHIANRALLRVGETRIITDIEERTTNAELCFLCLDDMRRAELEAHPWKFAIRTVQLPEVKGIRGFENKNVFQLPVDYLRMWRPQGGGTGYDGFDSFPIRSGSGVVSGVPVGSFEIQDGYYVSNDFAPIEISYVRDLKKISQMSPLFIEAWILRVAQTICEPITQSKGRLEGIRKEYKQVIQKARQSDAFNRGPLRIRRSSYIRGRQGF